MLLAYVKACSCMSHLSTLAKTYGREQIIEITINILSKSSSPTDIYTRNNILSSFESIHYRETEKKNNKCKEETMARSVPYPGLSNYSVPQANAYYYQATPLCKKFR
jgi:hypothetical protein